MGLSNSHDFGRAIDINVDSFLFGGKDLTDAVKKLTLHTSDPEIEPTNEFFMGMPVHVSKSLGPGELYIVSSTPFGKNWVGFDMSSAKMASGTISKDDLMEWKQEIFDSAFSYRGWDVYKTYKDSHVEEPWEDSLEVPEEPNVGEQFQVVHRAR